MQTNYQELQKKLLKLHHEWGQDSTPNGLLEHNLQQKVETFLQELESIDPHQLEKLLSENPTILPAAVESVLSTTIILLVLAGVSMGLYAGLDLWHWVVNTALEVLTTGSFSPQQIAEISTHYSDIDPSILWDFVALTTTFSALSVINFFRVPFVARRIKAEYREKMLGKLQSLKDSSDTYHEHLVQIQAREAQIKEKQSQIHIV